MNQKEFIRTYVCTRVATIRSNVDSASLTDEIIDEGLSESIKNAIWEAKQVWTETQNELLKMGFDSNDLEVDHLS